MKIEKPKGTRDFYPEDMAWQNYITDAWRRVSIRHGFEEVDGPIFEKLDLYKVKSGDGIVSELFSFRRENGSTDFALRPEFTPTLARMVADRANSLPKPIKWFTIPNLCRAERPQRGRLREFLQWNVDLLGLESELADAETILVAIDFLSELGVTPEHVRVKISHRDVVKNILITLGVPEDKILDAFNLLDRRDKMESEDFEKAAMALGLDEHRVQRFQEACRSRYRTGSLGSLCKAIGMPETDVKELQELDDKLHDLGIAEWCEYDLGIVRGLAYYTGVVYEIHESSGAERALAGGGRYDNLINLFGGPKTPAVGFGMGDVVLSNLLRDKGLIPDHIGHRPDIYVLAVSDLGAKKVLPLVADLRAKGLHARFSYKTTKNMGRLLKEAVGASSRYALILDDAPESGQLKNLDTQEQVEVRLDEVAKTLHDAV
ncbi:Histidine--tRNA ligase [Poriferisphaera corsica]|uniref:Histidine--tRNA ligase n=1 Tax=Poriferisphaera corsica TaxID=2528020 RepID=A0A517YYJ9_9BACT|nr:histidine--tRNA ligase [Poriferisphaera corsica]QDU35281.1 Histidine--tRNA ligase [Poriferisphaera corsica]